MTQFGVAPSGPMSRQPSRPHNIMADEIRRRRSYKAEAEKHRRRICARIEAMREMHRPCETMANIVRRVAEKHGYTVTDLKSDRRSHDLVVARHEAIWECAEHTLHSYPKIGRFFGGRDHSTVMYACRQHEKRLAAALDMEGA